MSALDGVLADLVEADRECACNRKRESLEALIDEWARRGDQVSLFAVCLLYDTNSRRHGPRER